MHTQGRMCQTINVLDPTFYTQVVGPRDQLINSIYAFRGITNPKFQAAPHAVDYQTSIWFSPPPKARLGLKHPLVLVNASHFPPQTRLQRTLDLLLDRSGIPMRIRLAVQLDQFVLLFWQ